MRESRRTLPDTVNGESHGCLRQGGVAGGSIVADGTLEEVTAVEASFTGPFLREHYMAT
ncbi:hypothetical protein ACFQI7_22715 [Paenibacillus allorhizosphaerae]|uniref:Uncharacterized protein n=1 Tax=Paenibacillus allorhizosphaerae TaxID=2849866 RepID=A0ABM8VQU4_9BACL|nr:hypothetical protein [Paenibacillus allorhizosphaerae]CAG7654689.1 hypothetical protein PAECIP111802_05840 [Paenibacillus allorhizosphaerae]